MRSFLTVLLAAVAAGSGAEPQPPARPPGPAVAADPIWYGLLHAHTFFSDGSGTPNQAYETARTNGLDFFADTPHNHADAEIGAKDRTDGILIATTPALYASDNPVTIVRKGQTITVKSVRRAALDQSTPTFLGMYGQEFSSISKGNHVNVFGVDSVITVENGAYKSLFKMLADQEAAGGERAVIQLNHPEVHMDLFYHGSDPETLNKMFNDYGFDDYDRDFRKLVGEADRYVRLIEVLSGPALSKVVVPNFNYNDHEDDYYFYLVQGFHVSPSVGHDDHYEHWGTKTDARMGVFAPSLSRQDFFEALRTNRTFASEDQDLRLEFQVNGEPMGSVLALGAEEALQVTATITDPSDPSAIYEVSLIHGTVKAQTANSLLEVKPKDGVIDTVEPNSSGVATFDGLLASGQPEFFYVRALQDDGDQTWSAPVWINHPRDVVQAQQEVFAWTSGTSALFHHQWCRTVGSIAEGNLQTGPTPPAGRQLHVCKPKTAAPNH